MKTLIIYTSVHHGNTEKIAKAMAKSLNADLLKPNRVTEDVLAKYTLIGFGSGIYFSKSHESILGLVSKLSPQDNKKAFVFSTSGLGLKKSNNQLIEALKEKKFDIAGSFTCRGYDTYGPFKFIGGLAKGRPNAKDLLNAKVFADKLVK